MAATIVNLPFDIQNEIFQYFGLADQLILRTLDNIHKTNIQTPILIEFDDFKKRRPCHQLNFENACIFGYLHLAKYFYSHSTTDITDVNAFIASCSEGHLTIVKWLYDQLTSTKEMTNSLCIEAFRECCENGHIHIAQWFHTVGILSDFCKAYDYAQSNNDDLFNLRAAFQLACENGHLELAKWLYKEGACPKFYGYFFHCSFFYTCCKNGNIEMARWLHEIGVDTHSMLKDAFVHACRYDNVHHAKFLYEIGPGINIPFLQLFLESCESGYLEMAKWLYQLDKFKLNSNYNYLVRCSPKNITDWLKAL